MPTDGDNIMKHILDSVREYIQEKHASRSWEAGRDFVNYACSYYDAD